MRVTIDKAGRVVVPKSLREELGLRPETELEAVAVDGRLEISVRATPMHLERSGGSIVAVSDAGPLPELTSEEVRATLERVRR